MTNGIKGVEGRAAAGNISDQKGKPEGVEARGRAAEQQEPNVASGAAAGTGEAKAEGASIAASVGTVSSAGSVEDANITKPHHLDAQSLTTGSPILGTPELKQNERPPPPASSDVRHIYANDELKLSPNVETHILQQLIQSDKPQHAQTNNIELAPDAGNLSLSSTLPTAKEAPRHAKRRARSPIGRAVLRNQNILEIAAVSFLALLDENIKRLACANSEEARQELENYKDLTRRVEEFLTTTSKFAVGTRQESALVRSATSLKDGILDWWEHDHVQICNTAYKVGMFGIGLTICHLTGVPGFIGGPVSGTLVGGKVIVDAIKAANKMRKRGRE